MDSPFLISVVSKSTCSNVPRRNDVTEVPLGNIDTLEVEGGEILF